MPCRGKHNTIRAELRTRRQISSMNRIAKRVAAYSYLDEKEAAAESTSAALGFDVVRRPSSPTSPNESISSTLSWSSSSDQFFYHRHRPAASTAELADTATVKTAATATAAIERATTKPKNYNYDHSDSDDDDDDDEYDRQECCSKTFDVTTVTAATTEAWYSLLTDTEKLVSRIASECKWHVAPYTWIAATVIGSNVVAGLTATKRFDTMSDGGNGGDDDATISSTCRYGSVTVCIASNCYDIERYANYSLADGEVRVPFKPMPMKRMISLADKLGKQLRFESFTRTSWNDGDTPCTSTASRTCIVCSSSSRTSRPSSRRYRAGSRSF